jgi:hypothetical protein
MYISSVCSDVSSSFPDVCLQVFHLDVAYVFTSVSNVYSKCFSCFLRMLQLFSSRCFKSRSDVVFICIFQVFHIPSYVRYKYCMWMF